MQRLLAVSRPDTNRVELLIQLAWDRTDDDPLAGIRYGRQSLDLARRLGYARGECRALLMIGWAFMRTGNHSTALQTQLQARRLAEAMGWPGGVIHANNAIGYAHAEQENYPQALRYYHKARAQAEALHDSVLLTPILGNIGQAHLRNNQLDSAWYFTHRGYEYDLRFRDRHSEIGDLSLLGDVEVQRRRPGAARGYYRASIARAQGMPVSYALCRSYLGLARLSLAGQRNDSAIYHGLQALQASRRGRYAKGVFEASGLLADVCAARGNMGRAYSFLRVAAATRDSLFSQTRTAQVQALDFNEQLRENDLAAQRLRAAARRQQQLLLAALTAVIVVAVLVYLLLSRQRLRREVEFAQERQQLERQRAQAVLEAEEAERRRIGYDLHDGVGQLLTVAKLNLAALSEELNLQTEGQQQQLDNALSVVDESFREVRSISHNLLPNALIKRGLARAVRDFLDKLAPNGRLKINLEVVGLDRGGRLEPTVENVLFRVIQELVQNILKHARATEITLQIVRHEHELTVLVEDNGVGFDPAALGEEAGIGLKNIESRMAYLGGRVEFDAAPGRGTTVTLEVPLVAETK